MSIKIKAGATAFEESNGRTIEMVGRHFSDYDVRIHEDVFDDDHDDPVGEKVTDAIFTQQEIDKLFGCGSHVSLDDEAEQIARDIRMSGEWDAYLCERLCDLADMREEWNAADGESFESVVYAAAEKLGVEV